MASEVLVAGRKFWIVYEPGSKGWSASVLEVLDGRGQQTRDLGIHAKGETRGAADEAARGQLQRHLRTAR